MPKKIIDKDRENNSRKIDKAVDKLLSSNYPVKRAKSKRKK